MRFMMLVIPKGYETAEPGTMPDPDAIAEMQTYNESLQKAGVVLAMDGLHPPSMGARVTYSGGRPSVHDGPFAEAKEVLGGYWIIQVKSREEAIEWAKRAPMGDNEIIEIRQVQELEDFAPSEAIERYRRARDEIAARNAGRAGLKTHPYVHYNGNCAEAFKAYADILGGQIDMMMTHGEAPPEMQVHADWKDKIMHAQLSAGDIVLMGSDAPPQYFRQPQGFSVSLHLDDVAEAERIFAALAEGGTVGMPIVKTFWAERFGMLTDRFGIPWMVNCGMAG